MRVPKPAICGTPDARSAGRDARGFAELRAEIARSSQRVIMWTVGLMVPGFVALFAAAVARG